MGENSLKVQLLTPCKFVIRSMHKAFLNFLPSPTSQHEVYMESRTAYALCKRLECDPKVIRFNFAVCELTLTIGTEKIKFKVKAVSEDPDGQLTAHWWSTAEVKAAIEDAVSAVENHGVPPKQTKARRKRSALGKSDAASISIISEWCKRHRVVLKVWSIYDLEHFELLTERLCQVLPFANPAIRDDGHKSDVYLQLVGKRSWTIAAILQARKEEEEPKVLAAVARLILEARLFTDLHVNDFSKATEVSVFHAFDAVEARS